MAPVLDMGLLGKAVLEAGEGKIEARGEVPGNLELFKDHFPAFPVLPGVLILGIFKNIADYGETCFNKRNDAGLRLGQVKRVKFTSFLKPGAAWESVLERVPSEEGVLWKARLTHGDQRIAAADLWYQGINR